jgi:hypothetical protein
MTELKSSSGNLASDGTKNTVNLGGWTLAWLVTMAIAAFGPIFIWEYSKFPTIAAIVINLAVGVGMIFANIRHQKGLDEMHQKIQLEAMGLSLGVGIVAGLSYSLLDTTNVISTDAEISYLVILMGLTYAAGVAAGLRKYR